MSSETDIQSFRFRSIHPKLLMGTGSDRYAGWLGQIYSPQKYIGRIKRRTTSLPVLCPELFHVFEDHGLPSLRRQFNLSGKRFFNASGDLIIRLMTPRGMRYEDAYAKAHPFDKLIDGMLQGSMVRDTVEIAREAIDQRIRPNIIINNRAGGNAPLIAQKVARSFMQCPTPISFHADSSNT
ncbi:MAG: hypothetical protein JRJ75_17355 [Deltaproteobacteria bacterium]|nr:hypothetical protein [Deltaproteobacteria bacterium]